MVYILKTPAQASAASQSGRIILLTIRPLWGVPCTADVSHQHLQNHLRTVTASALCVVLNH